MRKENIDHEILLIETELDYINKRILKFTQQNTDDAEIPIIATNRRNYLIAQLEFFQQENLKKSTYSVAENIKLLKIARFMGLRKIKKR